MKRSETTSKLLIDEPPLQVLPSLANKIGLNEAIVLQQIHYWLRTFQSSGKKDHLKDGKWWVYNTYDEWQDNFPFWGIGVIRRAIRNLEKNGLLISKEFNATKGDRTKWYSIDYKILAKLSRESKTAKAPDPSVVDDIPSVVDDIPSDQNEQMLNKKQRLATEINSLKEETEEKSKSKSKSEYTQNMEHLEKAFAEKRCVPEPNWNNGNPKELNKRWRSPLKRMLALCSGDLDKCVLVIGKVITKMVEDGLILDAPASIEKNFNSFIADLNLQQEGGNNKPNFSRIWAKERAEKERAEQERLKQQPT